MMSDLTVTTMISSRYWYLQDKVIYGKHSIANKSNNNKFFSYQLLSQISGIPYFVISAMYIVTPTICEEIE